MSVTEFKSRCIPFSTDGILDEVNDTFSNYRTQIKSKARQLMLDYNTLTEFEGTDIPDTFYDRETETCCAVFNGTTFDLDVIEEYIKARSICR